eukprot:CAMPEP_0184481560 /NCGR_PEP_ID=MMETSP0113_2-20130426/3111_1 /TAXON_ID=91329 /ORGANISM="Norrisiella sphaerica, Strain BC52" /LENGTH=523 /DNA_ID=CAMNT_0026860757 /DNA_START=56 /DNA_END=1627 /DNA_ORIENTATION=+
MPLKKCFSSPHLSQLVKAAEKENPRVSKVKLDAPAPKENRDAKLNGHNFGKTTLKKCFSSPHLKDLNNLEPADHSSELQDSSRNEGSAFRNEVINCRFRSCGCTVRLSRERMDSHLRTNAATHSLLILNKIDDLSRQNEQILKRLQTFETSMNSMVHLFESLQDVLASKGIPTAKAEFSKGSLLDRDKSTMDLDTRFPRPTSEPLAGLLSEHKDTKMLQTLANLNAATKNTKRMPDHLDLAMPSQPLKRQRKNNLAEMHSLPQVPMNFPTAASAVTSAAASHFNGTNPMQLYSSALSMATSAMPVSTNGGVNGATYAHALPHSAQYSLMSQMGLDPSQSIDPSLHSQPKQASRRMTDASETKGKSSSKRKVRSRVKKGKNIFEAPKKPKTAYNYYQIGVRESIMAEISNGYSGGNKEEVSQKVARIIGERWKNMPSHEREAFNTLASQDKQRYKRELEEYVQLKAQLKEACKSSNPMMQGHLLLGNHHAGHQQGMGMRVNYGLTGGVLAMTGSGVSITPKGSV